MWLLPLKDLWKQCSTIECVSYLIKCYYCPLAIVLQFDEHFLNRRMDAYYEPSLA